MGLLLNFSRAVDAVNEWLGRVIIWFVLGAVLVSAVNAVARKAFNVGSNAFLEVQWYLFAAVFMLGVGYVMLRNGHVRIDFIASRLSRRTNALIDAIGIVVFTIPLSIIMIDLGWPLFWRAFQSGEMSQNAGGLIRWPVLMLVPVGFALLLLQSLSELVKRVAFLRGRLPDPFTPDPTRSEEERLAEEVAAHQAAAATPGAR